MVLLRATPATRAFATSRLRLMLTPAASSPAPLRSPPSRGTANTTAAMASAQRSTTSPEAPWAPSPPQPTSTPRSSVGRNLEDWVTSSIPHFLAIVRQCLFFFTNRPTEDGVASRTLGVVVHLAVAPFGSVL